MKALMWPILPCTTMSMPFIEIPQRRRGIALDHQQPAMRRRPGILAGIAVNDDVPDIMFSADPGPTEPIWTVACLFMPAQ